MSSRPTRPRRRELGAAGRSPVGRRRHGAKDDAVTGQARVRARSRGSASCGRRRSRVRLEGVGDRRPRQVIATWKAHFPTFWPKARRFYAPLSGIKPGEVGAARHPPVPGSPVKLSTGVMVIYADDESFTFMTPEGHALSAWITFSAHRDGDVASRRRRRSSAPADPFDEIAYMLGGNRHERPILAGDAAQPRASRSASPEPDRGDPGGLHRRRRQWRHARNVRNSASIRTMRRTPGRTRCAVLHRPEVRAGLLDDRRRGRRDRRRGRARTGWPRRSPWPGPAVRSGSTRPPRTAGGGMRTAELTLPGFRHDVVLDDHPAGRRLAVLPVDRPRGATGVELDPPRRAVRPPARRRNVPWSWSGPLRRPRPASGRVTADAWRRLFGPLVRDGDELSARDAAAGRPRAAPSARCSPGSGCPPSARSRASPRSASTANRARALFAGRRGARHAARWIGP